MQSLESKILQYVLDKFLVARALEKMIRKIAIRICVGDRISNAAFDTTRRRPHNLGYFVV